MKRLLHLLALVIALHLVPDQARAYYDPNLQRWIQRDPIGELGGINLHGFVGNNPLSNFDPDGLKWVLFDGQAWHQLIKDFFIGSDQRVWDKDSYHAEKISAGVGVTQLTDANGNVVSGGDAVMMIGGKVVGGTITAATLIPAAGEEGAYIAADRALEAARLAKVEKAAGECKIIGADLATGTKALTKVEDILLPGGKVLGQAGTDVAIREIEGGLKEAEALFEQLAQGGKVIQNPTYPGKLVQLPNGGTVGLRTVMTKSPGTAATIDINIAGIPIDKIKYNP